MEGVTSASEERVREDSSRRTERTYWSVLTRADLATRPYQDVLGAKYVYTSQVPNYKRIVEGDVFLVRDEDVILGAGMVDQIRVRGVVIQTKACPACERSGISTRKSISPTFRCNRCHHEFEEPLTRRVEGLEFEAFYGQTWEEFTRPVPRQVLNSLLAAKPGQNAIHRLDLSRTEEFLRRHSSVGFSADVRDLRAPASGGHSEMTFALTNLLNGSNRFRDMLIAKFGEACALTGPCPAEALQPVRIIALDERDTRFAGAGFLLRSDLYALFESNRLTVDAAQGTVALAPEVRRFDLYAGLQGAAINLPFEVRLRADALAVHRSVATETWS